MAALKGQQP